MGDGRQVWTLKLKGLDWGSRGSLLRKGTIEQGPALGQVLASAFSGIPTKSCAVGQGLMAGCALRSLGSLETTKGGSTGEPEGSSGPGHRHFSKVPRVILMCILAQIRWVSTMVLKLGEVVRTTRRAW